MRTVRYIRVSTTDQNEDRQRVKGVKSYVDKISGSIEFNKRPAAFKMYVEIVNSHQQPVPAKRITTISVDSISRLGRSTIDILKTVNGFTDMGVCIESEKEAIKTCDNEGKQTPTARLLLSVMATLAQFEIEQKKERQMEGIERAKKAGKYKLNAGRSKESSSDFINKDKNQRILKMLEKGAGIREIERTLRSRREKASLDTIRKVKRIAEELDLLKRAKSNEEKLKAYFKD